MEGYQKGESLATPDVSEIAAVLQAWELAQPEERDFQAFELKVRNAVMALELRVLSQGLASMDIDCEQIQIRDQMFTRLEVARVGTYFTLAGEISVRRHLYRPEGKGKPICPMDIRAGVIEGAWTPRAAEIMAHSAAVMTPYEAEALLPKFGGLAPSRSSLDRLPKALSKRWEENRALWESAIRETEIVPIATGIVVASLDGVTIPMKDGQRAEKREEARTQGKQTRGPAGYREAGCGVVSLFSDHQERLQTVYYGRMPESKKVTLHQQLLAETSAILSTVPCPILVLMSDGALDNWRILNQVVESLKKENVLTPDDVVYRIADFFHASEHLKKATDLYYGANSPKSYGAHETLRRCLRDQDDGVEIVVKKLLYYRNQATGKRRKKLSTQLEYFRSRTEQMRYVEFQRLGLPIGTGITEAACKTLVTQRMKRSGMRWEIRGGQGVLTLRSLLRSDRWDVGWQLLSDSYRPTIRNVTRKKHLSILSPFGKVA